MVEHWNHGRLEADNAPLARRGTTKNSLATQKEQCRMARAIHPCQGIAIKNRREHPPGHQSVEIARGETKAAVETDNAIRERCDRE